MPLTDDYLSTHAFFSGLSEDYIELLSEFATQKHVAKGNVLFQQGKPADKFYLVRKGKVSGVFFRYVLDDALAWSEEIAKFLMVWMTFVAAPIAYKTGALVAIEAFPRALKGRVREVLLIVIEAIVITLMLVFIIKGTFLAQNASIQRASTIDFSIMYVYAAMPVGAFMVLMIAVQSMVASLRYILGGPAPENRFLDFAAEAADESPLHKATEQGLKQ